MNASQATLLALFTLSPVGAAEPPGAPEQAIQALMQLGGEVSYRGQELSVAFRENTSDADLKHLKPLTHLGHLDLSRTRVTDAGMAHLKALTNLKSLDLYDTAVSDEGLKQFEGMKKLCFLMAKQTNVTEEGAARLKRALPDCETISHSPRTPAIALPTGHWKLNFTNGVAQTCEIRADRTVFAAEPLRESGGKAYVQGRTVKLVFADDRVERWTPVGDKFVVEHWAASADFPAASPVLGIAEKAP